jgi:hypothetical protein
MAEEEKANLGLATTRELLLEVAARIAIDFHAGGGGLDYTAVHGRPEDGATPARPIRITP